MDWETTLPALTTDPWPDKGTTFNLYALGLLEVRDDHCPHANGTVVLDRDEVWTRGIEDNIVSYPNALPDTHTASTVQIHAKL